MSKIDLLKNLVEKLENNCPDSNPEFKYIGTGNPKSNILIIGKEAAIDPEIDLDQAKTEITDNFKKWKKICDSNLFDQSAIPFRDFSKYSPLYPYKGQVFKIDNGGNWGTSRTWYNYQKLVNLIYGKENNQKIDFHERVFISEVNSSPSPKTKNADISSIEFRKKVLLNSDFIKSFPVVIIAGVGYFEIGESSNELEDIFDVHFKEKKIGGNKENQPYWIHVNSGGSKILINSYQLSINISDALLKEIAFEIRKYLK